MMKAVIPLLFAVLLLATQTSSLLLHSAEDTKVEYPQLQGNQFKIKEGDFSTSAATFSFSSNSVSWRQCNYYHCTFTQ